PRLLPEIQHATETERISGGWRAVVAEYLTLYTTDTLANIPDDAAVRARELEAVGNKLGAGSLLRKGGPPATQPQTFSAIQPRWKAARADRLFIAARRAGGVLHHG